MKKLLFIFLFLPGIVNAQKGYVNFTTFGFLKGSSSDQRQAPLSIISEHHGMIANRFSAGLMTGIEELHENVMPLAASMRYYLPGKTRVFLGGYMGYSVSLEKPFYGSMDNIYKKAKGGFMTGLETGLMIPVNDVSSVFFGIGYRHNILHYELEDYWAEQIRRKITFNRLSLRMGIVLN